MAKTVNVGIEIKNIEKLELLGGITQAAIEWADAYELEHSRDERALQSTVIARTTAARKLQEIRRLVKELRSETSHQNPAAAMDATDATASAAYGPGVPDDAGASDTPEVHIQSGLPG